MGRPTGSKNKSGSAKKIIIKTPTPVVDEKKAIAAEIEAISSGIKGLTATISDLKKRIKKL